MGNQFKGPRPARRYVRVPGPFGGVYLGSTETPVRIYELNQGGGFLNFMSPQPEESKFAVQIDLPYEGPITVQAETVYRHQFGVAVRFVDVDADTSARLARTVEALTGL
jgi:hypothetical protein